MKQIVRILLVLAISVSASCATAYAAVSVSALDTVANFGTVMKASGLAAGADVDFVVTKPDGSVYEIKKIADQSGRASVNLPENETRMAGAYAVAVNGSGATSVFRVFPGEMNPQKSSVYTDKSSVAADGIRYAKLTVRIVDDFGNPLESHEIKLVSSRNTDRILENSATTDGSGLASFLVFSQYPGVSSFTATDGSAQTTIFSRATITFVRSRDTALKAIGGDPQTVLLAQAGGQSVAQFGIENMSATLNTNETTSFRVKAVDSSGSVVSSYVGTIIFSSTDPNAQLPNPYTFLAADQGQKTFELALTFRTPGSQRLIVQQQNNALVKGEKAVEVTAPGGANGGLVRITKPATGTYRVNTLEVAGEANPNDKVKIFDNGQQITEVQANASGRFSYTTSLLTDGQHTFHAESSGIQSSPVTITIDSTPAQIEQVNISKNALGPGESFNISVHSDPDLDSIQATVGDLAIDLQQDPQDPGVYAGTIAAPAQDGEYTVSVILTDRIGNVSQAAEIGKIKVDSNLKGGNTLSFNVPSKVQGVVAVPGNGLIALAWQAANAQSGIVQYRIYYGTDPTHPNLVANTKDSKTSWYIPNLQNGMKYYFQVVGIDANGNEGDNLSDTVNSTPSASASGVPGLCPGGICPQNATPPPANPQDGPEVLGMILISLFGGSAYRFFRKK